MQSIPVYRNHQIMYSLVRQNRFVSVRKLPDIHRELPRHVTRGSYFGGMFRILS
jgi:hypothetical protein